MYKIIPAYFVRRDFYVYIYLKFYRKIVYLEGMDLLRVFANMEAIIAFITSPRRNGRDTVIMADRR